MADELDLEVGDPSRGSADSEQRRRRRRERTSTSGNAATAREESKVENEIRSRLDRVFDRIVKARRAREDEELAEVIEEDAEAMAQGFLSMTTNVPFTRGPLIMFLNVLEPLLAFNRVVRILFLRFMERRARRYEEAQAAQAEYEAAVAANGEPAQ